MKKLIKVFLVASLLSHLQSIAQDSTSKKPLLLSFRSHYGFIIPHSEELIDVSGSSPWGGEIAIGWVQNGQEAWNSCQCFSQKGISIKYFNFANKDVLGSTIAVVPYIEPLIGARNRFYGSIKAQLGLAYLSQLYDAEENPSNLFFSFPISFFLGVEGNLYYKLDPYWQLMASANYNHISNGGLQEPNKGMNFPTFSVGVTRSFTPFSFPNYPKKAFDKSQRKTQLTVLAVLSGKNTPEENGFDSELRPIYGAAVQWRYQLGALSHLKLGTEALFNGHTQTMAERRGESGNYWEIAALAGHELVVGRIGFSQQLGIYLHKDFRETDLLYQRYGLSYRLSERLKIAGTLKAHRHIADILDFRLGYIF